MPRLPRAAGTRLRLGLPNLNDQWRLAAVRPTDKAGELRGHAHRAGREQTSRGVAGRDTNQE